MARATIFLLDVARLEVEWLKLPIVAYINVKHRVSTRVPYLWYGPGGRIETDMYFTVYTVYFMFYDLKYTFCTTLECCTTAYLCW